jgi:hypothetical protein
MSAVSASERTAPPPALILGVSGLIPFAASSAVIFLHIEPWETFAWAALRGYGAIILSFLGAVHWGLEVGRVSSEQTDYKAMWRTLGWGVTPALIAWVTLLMPRELGTILLTAGFTAQHWADERAFNTGRLRFWYIRLRRLLTAGVILCLFLALATTL